MDCEYGMSYKRINTLIRLSSTIDDVIVVCKNYEIDGIALNIALCKITELKKHRLHHDQKHDIIDLCLKYQPKNDAKNIAIRFHKLAKLDIWNHHLFDLLSHQAERIIDNFKAQGITNTLWSFATLNIRNDHLFDLLSHQAERRIDDFNSQEIANTFWSSSKINQFQRN